MYYGSADGLAPGITANWAGPHVLPGLSRQYDPRYNVNWARPDLGAPIFTKSPFLWHTSYFFPICPVIISSLGRHIAQPSWRHSSSSLSFTKWLDSVVKAARYMHAPGSNPRQVTISQTIFCDSFCHELDWVFQNVWSVLFINGYLVEIASALDIHCTISALP